MENQISPKEKQKTLQCFLFQMEAIVDLNLRLEKSVKIVEKSSFIQKKETFGSIIFNFVYERHNIVRRQLDLRSLSF